MIASNLARAATFSFQAESKSAFKRVIVSERECSNDPSLE